MYFVSKANLHLYFSPLKLFLSKRYLTKYAKKHFSVTNSKCHKIYFMETTTC